MQWLIDGALAYQEQGLNPPQAVLEATASYFEDEDTLAQWIAECCETGPDLWDKPTLLFNSWKDFTAAANFIPGPNKDFKSKIEAAGYRYHKTGLRGRHYEGIQIKPSNSNQEGHE